MRRYVGVDLAPLDVLRRLRDQHGLVALLGDWHPDGPVIGYAPVRTVGGDGDPFAVLAPPAARADAPDTGGLGGGWIGYWGYQLGRLVERLPEPRARPVRVAEAQLGYYDHLLRRDVSDGRWYVEGLPAVGGGQLEAQAERARQLLARPVRADALAYKLGDLRSVPSVGEHLDAVARAIEHIDAGDIFQANICRRLEGWFDGDPLDVFCAGYERLQPRFGAFLRTPTGAVVSFSPELFLRRTGDEVLTSPIKGTRPLDEPDDLASSAKDRAENVMIVDLMRNDLGRVCVPGTVRVDRLLRIEPHTGVQHLISDVRGRLRPDAGDTELLRATFPPGSVTGAPKVRAMEVIDELEPTGREVYTGAIGYAGDRAMALSVAIRTFEFAAGRVWLGVGGGIVADSVPAVEGIETEVKAAPLLAAIGAPAEESSPVTESATVADPAAPTNDLGPPLDVVRPDPAAGVFETMLVIDGRVLELSAHLDRLRASVASGQVIGGQVIGSRRDSLPPDLRTRVERYAWALRGRHRLRVDVRLPDLRGEITSLPAGDPPATGWRLVPRVVAGGWGGHKWRDRGLLAQIEPAAGTWDPDCDALLVDSDGSVLETGRGNVFVVHEDRVVTPVLDGRILPGTTRDAVIALLERAGVHVLVADIAVEELAGAHEVFVSSSINRIRAVDSCDGIGTWPTGPMTRWLRSGVLEADAATCESPVPAFEPSRLRIVLVDNYDSFVYNLDQYLGELGIATTVVRNDATTVAELEQEVLAGSIDGVVISPGPGRPEDAGISNDLVRVLGSRLPILGVCLGHQCIAQVYGAQVVRADAVVHGKSSLVYHDSVGVFAGLSGPLTAGRYHSLVVEPSTLPDELAVTARTGSGVVMGLRHRSYPVEGVQFHPESILTRNGHHILANFLGVCARLSPVAVP